MFSNERAYGLIETDMTPYRASRAGTTFAPDTYRGLHRYQVIGVNRDGRVALWMHDMGPSSNFSFGPLHVLSLWEETVAWCQEKADEIRDSDQAEARDFVRSRQQALRERWPVAAERQAHERKAWRSGQSVFGSIVRVERRGV